MSEVNINDFEFNIDDEPKNKAPISISSNNYDSYSQKRLMKKKKPTCLSILIILLEICFVLLAVVIIIDKVKRVLKKEKLKKAQKIENLSTKQQLTQVVQNVEKNEVNAIVKKDVKDMKIALCTPVKKDNRYLKEYVKFYKKWGVDQIFLYDNNEIDDEKFEEVIGDYIDNDYVKVMDWRGKHKILLEMMNDCYQRNNKDFDWLIFYETDEFIHLKGYTNIKDFLHEDKFDKCNKVYLNWVFHTDNDLYHYEDKPVQERFPVIEPKPEGVKALPHTFFKTMIRGNLSNVQINCVHRLNKEMKGCNGYGLEPEITLFRMEEQDYENYYIDHYFSRSVDEFIDKLKKGDSIRGHDIPFKIGTFGNYFGFNNMNIEKIEYVEKRTGLDLSKYKKI